MLPWSFSEEAAVEKHTAQLQHNMLVAATSSAVLIITGGGKWVELTVQADPLYQTVLLAVEKAFWHAVQAGEPPRLYDAEPPRPRLAALRVVDMSSSNAWAEFGALYLQTRAAHADHERAKSELKTLMPDDAKEAFGHGVRARRSRAGSVSFDVLEMSDAANSENIAELGRHSLKHRPNWSIRRRIPPGRHHRGDGQAEVRTFRYASLSAGLDIVRNTLGEHGIAVLQSTAVILVRGWSR